MPEQLAYDITRLLFEKQAELAAIHPEAAHLSLDRAEAARRRHFTRRDSLLRRQRPLMPRERRPAIERRTPRRLNRLQEFSGRSLSGWPGALARGLAIGLSLYSLYWVLFVVQPQVYRVSFLLVALVLIFLLVPARPGRDAGTVAPLDWLLHRGGRSSRWRGRIVDFRRFVYRAADPLPVDVVLGAVADPARPRGDAAHGRLDSAGHRDRRSSSTRWAGPVFDRIGLPLIAHRGYALDRLVGTLYMTLEGMFGVPLDVAATYIILFTIYGAVLEHSGAGRFFIDWSMAAMRTVARPAPRPGAPSPRRVSARHGLRQRRRDDRDAGLGGVAAAARRRLPAGVGRRDPVGRRHRRAALAADARRRGVPHRRVPARSPTCRCS